MLPLKVPGRTPLAQGEYFPGVLNLKDSTIEIKPINLDVDTN